jgi:hypothetical protein
MTYPVGEILDKIVFIDEYIKIINRGAAIGRMDAENIRDLLDEYRDVLINAKVHI